MRHELKNSKVQSEIDANLKRAFNEVANERVPDKFTDLLHQLRSAEAEKKKPKKDSDDVGS